MGIKGASILRAHEPFDLVKGTVIDSMHCVFLGVMSKTLIPLWFNVGHRLEPYSIRRKVCASVSIMNRSSVCMYVCMYVCSCIQLKKCNDRLTKIQVPHDFSRAVKGLDQVKLCIHNINIVIGTYMTL